MQLAPLGEGCLSKLRQSTTISDAEEETRLALSSTTLVPGIVRLLVRACTATQHWANCIEPCFCYNGCSGEKRSLSATVSDMWPHRCCVETMGKRLDATEAHWVEHLRILTAVLQSAYGGGHHELLALGSATTQSRARYAETEVLCYACCLLSPPQASRAAPAFCVHCRISSAYPPFSRLS